MSIEEAVRDIVSEKWFKNHYTPHDSILFAANAGKEARDEERRITSGRGRGLSVLVSWFFGEFVVFFCSGRTR